MSQTTKVGAKGEAMVISELTERSWAVAKPIVDVGIDLLACKVEDGKVKTVAVQVKTITKPSHGGGTCYGFNIGVRDIIDGVYYIIVCPATGEYIVLTSDQVRKKWHVHKGRDSEWDEFRDRWDLLL